MAIKDLAWIKQHKNLITPYVNELVDTHFEKQIPPYGPTAMGYIFRTSNDFKLYTRPSGYGDAAVSTIGVDSNINESIKPSAMVALHHGVSAICSSEEEFNIPKGISGFIIPNENILERGLIVQQVGVIHPGYKGRIKFLVTNAAHLPVLLYSSIGIATVCFQTVEDY